MSVTQIKRQHTKYPKIGQFKDVLLKANKYAAPGESKVIQFTGTVKLHGTNFGVCRKREGGEFIDYALSRSNIITVESDNAGSAFFHESNKELFDGFLTEVERKHADLLNTTFSAGYIVSIFGEWCGGNIQGKVALTELPKQFVVFGLKVSSTLKAENPDDEVIPSVWLDHSWINSPENRIYNIDNFKKFHVSVDFDKPATALEIINQLTLEVERECPFAKEFGVSGIGEGIVWSAPYKDGYIRFKSKGEKHTGKKETVNKPAVDMLVLENVNKFVDYAVTEGRLNQAIQDTVGIGNEKTITMQHLGAVIKWIRHDIDTEEVNTLVDSGLEPKDVVSAVCKRTKEMFIQKVNEI